MTPEICGICGQPLDPQAGWQAQVSIGSCGGLKYLGVKVVGYLTGLGGHVGSAGHRDDFAGHPQQRVQNETQLYCAYPLL